MGRRSRHPWFDSPKSLMLWSLSWTSPNTSLHLHEAPASQSLTLLNFNWTKNWQIIEISMWWNFMKWKCSWMQSVENNSTFYSAQHDFFSHDLSQNCRRILQPICCFAIFCKGTTYSRTNCYLLIASYDTSSFNLKWLTFTKFRTLRSSPKLRPWRAKSKIATGFHLRTVAWNVQL